MIEAYSERVIETMHGMMAATADNLLESRVNPRRICTQ